MNKALKASLGYMSFSAVLTVILGLVMLFYPGGTIILMSGAYWVFQFILTFFILYYTLTETYNYFKADRAGAAFGYLLIGLLAALLVWLTDVRLVYYLAAFFLFLTGLTEIFAGSGEPDNGLLLILLGVVNILFGIMVLSNVFILPLLIAWYIIFWGISRLLFCYQLRRALPNK